jgi:hypothetical protein
VELREWRPSGVQFGSAVVVLLLNWGALGGAIALSPGISATAGWGVLLAAVLLGVVAARLSDHGQSRGATFHQRYGTTLGDLVRDLMTSADTRDTQGVPPVAVLIYPADWSIKPGPADPGSVGPGSVGPGSVGPGLIGTDAVHRRFVQWPRLAGGR